MEGGLRRRYAAAKPFVDAAGASDAAGETDAPTSLIIDSPSCEALDKESIEA